MILKQYDVVIIGAGASGLMTAFMAAQRGRSVLVLEKANKVGKKILMSGGGKCNFTNLYVTPENYLSHNPHFAVSALARYTQWDFLGLINDHGIAYEERKHGQLFTLEGAKQILAMLLRECEKTCHVTIETHAEVTNVTHQNGGFVVQSSIGNVQAESLVVASGGLSIPTLGGSGIGYEIAKQFGHTVLPRRAGLVPFTFSDGFKAIASRLSGTAVDVVLSNQRASFAEALLFTHRGLSGPAALQLSNYWQDGEPFTIDLLPSIDAVDWLLSIKRMHPKSVLRTQLTEHLPKSVVLELQALIWATARDEPLGQWSDERLRRLGQQLQAFEVRPAGTEGYRTAEVTLGGVDTTEVSSKTMESNHQKGLYFIGEVLDVTGHLGGFNFQWAWASAHAAAGYV